jgi:hypothetical protein
LILGHELSSPDAAMSWLSVCLRWPFAQEDTRRYFGIGHMCCRAACATAKRPRIWRGTHPEYRGHTTERGSSPIICLLQGSCWTPIGVVSKSSALLEHLMLFLAACPWRSTLPHFACLGWSRDHAFHSTRGWWTCTTALAPGRRAFEEAGWRQRREHPTTNVLCHQQPPGLAWERHSCSLPTWARQARTKELGTQVRL